MQGNKFTVILLDDNIPKDESFVELSMYDGVLSPENLNYLLKSKEWTGQRNLRQLTELILSSEHSIDGSILTLGFTHPSLCLDEIDQGLHPDVIVFDWEYGSESSKESANYLLELAEDTDAFIFVYSAVRNSIPPFLNQEKFDKYSKRFQLFLKGENDGSIFSSEEFIYQYIISQVSHENRIIVGGNEIIFKENGYLNNPTDILFLEKIFGRVGLANKLASIQELNNQSIENLLSSITIRVFIDKNKGLLVTEDSKIFLKRINSSAQIELHDVLKRFGIETVIELLNNGVTSVN